MKPDPTIDAIREVRHQISKSGGDDWKKDHPDGTPEEYAREMYETSEALFKEEYRDFEKYASQLSESSQKSLEEMYGDLEKKLAKFPNHHKN